MRRDDLDVTVTAHRHLTDCRPGERVRVLSVHLGRGAVLNMHNLGLVVGDEVEVLQRTPLGGPLLVRVRDTEVAIGRGLACRIDVIPVA
ncbi:MAG: FeoA family protein [Pseudomonadota bacterium]